MFGREPLSFIDFPIALPPFSSIISATKPEILAVLRGSWLPKGPETNSCWRESTVLRGEVGLQKGESEPFEKAMMHHDVPAKFQ